MVGQRLAALALVAGIAGTNGARVAQAATFDDWNVHAEQAIITIAAQNPAVASLSFAIFQGAVYDAVNAIDRRHTPFISQPEATADASIDAAIAAAAHDVLVGLFPAQAADLDTKYANSLAGIPNGPSKDDGIAVGQAAAAAMLAARANDGRFVDVPEYYTPLPLGPGVWVPVAGRGVFPWIGHVKPFTMESPDQFAPKEPSLSHRRWVRDYNEVKDYGGSVSLVRTEEQENLGRFWAEHTVRIWNRTLRGIAASAALDEISKARLYARFHVASADAVIGCWWVKYDVQFWRPQTAIAGPIDDGDPDTVQDPTWTSLLPTANHPEFPSGHTCYTGAVVQVLKHFFQSDRFSFAVTSLQPGTTQPTILYERFTDALEDIIDSRVYIGYHYRFSNELGAGLGRDAARHLLKNYFRHVRRQPR
jgi:VCPO second helical-bundle domain